MSPFDAGRFEDIMTSRPTDPPVTWSGWWNYPQNKEVFVDGIGLLAKVFENLSMDSDSYSYGELRVMVFEVRDCGPKRWFKVQKNSSSFDSGWDESDEAWQYPDVFEVEPEVVEVQRWSPV